MVLVNTKQMLFKAKKGKYAVGAFNTSNLEISKAIIAAAEEKKAPVILQTSISAIAYAGIKELYAITSTLARYAKVPVAIHLDHGPDYAWAKQCIAHHYTSVMIDASHLPFAQNVALTKKVVALAHKHNVTVEAELGRLQGIEDNINVSEQEAIFTSVEDAVLFVQKTGCDSLAVAVGTSHGAYKFKAKPQLDFKRIADIAKALPKTPLVLHGASSVPESIVQKAQRYGADLSGAMGVPFDHLRMAVKAGICKVNTDTDIRIAFDAAIREHLANNPKDFDPRKILGDVMQQIKEVVGIKIEVLGSKNKA
ncbi:MAG: class II fructose-1,6-bisphosphate aldolase [Candidatus Woesearchaeota archaeon]